MRMTTIHAQAERKRQDRSVCRAEKRLFRARMLRVRGLIHPTSAVCATTDTARGEKRLPSEQNQAILKSSGRPLGECRLKVSMTQEEAEKLYPRVKEFIQREGREPNLNSPNGREVRLADALAFLRRLSREKRAAMAGADGGQIDA